MNMTANQPTYDNLSESQKAVLQKYLVNDEKTWSDVCHRVADFVSSAEITEELKSEWYEKFMSILLPMKFMPGGSILANANHGTRGMMNCFVLSAEDNIQDIAKVVTDAILTTKFRGGVGINIGSKGQKGYIREKGSDYSDGKALGANAVLDMVSDCARKLTTGNKSRRGAFMFSMDWRHGDIKEFIQAKTQSVIDAEVLKQSAKGELSQEEFDKAWVETHLSPDGKRERRWYNANISVQVDNEFFEALDNAKHPQHEYVNELWDMIANLAHKTADPGLLLVDNAKAHSPIRDFILTTNPCGEIWLPKDSACNLGSIVLNKFVKDSSFDWADLIRTIEIAVRFLDNVLDVSEFATEGQKNSVRNKFRQIGLGIMGWADCLKLLQIPYDSDTHLSWIDHVGGLVANHAYRYSEKLADEKGACGVWDEIKHVVTHNSFELWESRENPPSEVVVTYSGDEILADSNGIPYECLTGHNATQKPRRNSTVLSIAPTGSIAQLANCSWAFEPDFGLSIWKQVYVDASKSEQQWVQIISPYLEPLGLSDFDKALVLSTGSLQATDFATDNPELASVFKHAGEITPEWHVRVQSHWQKWIDSSISKTVNLPTTATVEDIKQTYKLANDLGLKGITVYRSGTLESEPIKVGAKDSKSTDLFEPVDDSPQEPSQGCRSGFCELK